MEIKYLKNPSSELIEKLEQGIADYAKKQKDQKPIESFAFVIEDQNHNIMGGCNGSMYYGCIYIDQLWVDDTLRHKGYGTKLVQAAEKLGKDKGCTFSSVNTMDWEALDFYKNLGYSVEFYREGYEKNSTLFFLKKGM